MNYRTIIQIAVLMATLLGITALELISTTSKSDYELFVEKDEDGWTYRIHYKSRVLINQNYIPGIPSQKAFTSKKDAEMIGNLVINRLEKNDSPRISKGDLDENQIDY